MQLAPILFFLGTCSLGAQLAAHGQQAVAAEITKLEQLERHAITTGYTTTLKRLWANDFVVNNPDGRIVTKPQIIALIRGVKIDYVSFDRIIERITSSGNLAVAMGREVVRPQKNTSNAGKTVTRRYTDVWVHQANTWHLTARQATNVEVK
ncbi:hypothetical protein A0257_21605 [Hymenobacter psoromatis]|nr:hypothetical protein A0257_21605 [Hymenobacter psoromatis]